MNPISQYFANRKWKKRRKEIVASIKDELFANDDILSEKQKADYHALMDNAAALQPGDDRSLEILEKKLENCLDRKSFRKVMRGWLDVLAVALTVAFGIRALFAQPFSIPTSSMQPTLFGIHEISEKESESFTGGITKLFRKLEGKTLSQTDSTPVYNSTGDHLFVDRISIHFNPLKRGEIFIFNTEGLKYQGMPLQGYYYIKRVAGLSGDTLKIMEGRLYIRPAGENEFRIAEEFSDKFKRINSMKGGYQGHRALGLLDDGAEFTVPANCYFALGDNTNNSLDSRYWGPVPHGNVVGRAMMVFWPISRRFGWIDTLPPLDCPTEFMEGQRQPTAMRLQ